jgi:hypothetical protein
MKNSWFGIRIIIFLTVMAIAGSGQILSKAGVDFDTVLSTIALILFIGMMTYYLFPKSQGRRHRDVTSTHKQYNDSRLTDFMMERIMKVYNVKEEASEPEDDNDVYESTKSEFDNKNFQRRSGKEIVKAAEEKIDEETSEEVEADEEIAVEVKHKQYNDSRLTDYMMEKIMKAYNVKEETEDTDEDDEEFEEEDEETEGEFAEEFEEENIDSPTTYDNKRTESTPQPVIYNEDEEKATGLRRFFTAVNFPITLAVLWLIVLGTAENFIPNARQLIPKFVSPFAFTILPILFLVGLSGLVGILFKQSSENLESTLLESTSNVNILKLVIGWGGGIYFLIMNM